jgi:hypothetical protein
MDAAVGLGVVDLIGLGRPFCLRADVSRHLLSSEDAVAPNLELSFNVQQIDRIVATGINNLHHAYQLGRLADGLEPDFTRSLWADLLIGSTKSYIVDPAKYPTTTRLFVVLVMLWLALFLKRILS